VEKFGSLFDSAWYLRRNPDVAEQGLDPLRHYVEHGIAERRDPNPFFDTNWYLAQTLDLQIACSQDPDRLAKAERRSEELIEELDQAIRERDLALIARDQMIASTSWRVGQPLRNAATLVPPQARRNLRRILRAIWWAITPWKTRQRFRWLRQRNRPDGVASPAIAAATETGLHAEPDQEALGPLAHYVAVGAVEGRDPHPLFDTDWYLARNPDVAEIGINPLAHFLAIGASEGRAPHPILEADWACAQVGKQQVILPDPSRFSRIDSPLISVVVPVFNKAPFLRDCLHSILGQSLTEIELICIDDASTDCSLEILQEVALADPRMLILRNVTNSGPGVSRNAGIHLARGNFIQFTDADDILPHHGLRTLYDLATADGVQIVRGSLNSFFGTPDPAGLNIDAEQYQICPDRHNISPEDEPALSIPWWHTTYLIGLRFLREIKAAYPSLGNGEDPVFIARLLAHTKSISCTSQVTYLRRFADSWRSRTTLSYALDFVRHAAVVRQLYLEHHPRCWREVYRPFLLANVDLCFLQPWLMSHVEQDVIKLAMLRAGIGVYLPLRMRQRLLEAPHHGSIYDDVGTAGYWNGFFALPDPWDYSSTYEETKREHILSLIVPGECPRALELACAEGHFTELLAERVETLVALDISDVALERAASRCSHLTNVQFRRHDLVREPLAGEYDLIVCAEVLYYLGTIDRLRAVLRKMISTLVPDGTLILEHPNLVSDDPDETGYDWPGHAYGSRTIGEVVSDLGGMTLECEVKTSLYRIQRFRRRQPSVSGSPPHVLVMPLPVPLDRKLDRSIVWGGAIVTRDEALRREPSSALPIVMYHRIAESGPERLAPYRTHPKDFEQQVSWLRRRGYYSVSIDEWMSAIQTNTPLPGRPILFTFDDGYYDFFDKAWPILDRHGFSALVFLVAGNVGGVADWDASHGEPAPLMDWDAIRRLVSVGVQFGSHGLAHRRLDSVPIDQVREECAGSRMLLEAKLGGAIAAFSYPWGAHNEEVRHTVSEVGYRAGMATHPRSSLLTDDAFALPRLEVLGGFTLRDFARLLDTT